MDITNFNQQVVERILHTTSLRAMQNLLGPTGFSASMAFGQVVGAHT